MTVRDHIFEKLEALTSMEQTSEFQFNRLTPSGELVKSLYDYHKGYFEVSIYYQQLGNPDKSISHACIVIISNPYDHSVTSCGVKTSEQEAKTHLKEIVRRFKNMEFLPDISELNSTFEDLGMIFDVTP